MILGELEGPYRLDLREPRRLGFVIDEVLADAEERKARRERALDKILGGSIAGYDRGRLSIKKNVDRQHSDELIVD